MTKLEDILDDSKLQALIADKRIQFQTHPTLPLRVFNYTNRAQFTNLWSHEERICRGLIVDADANVIARGPSKFFNYGQPGAPEVSMDTLVLVTPKLDGSLGIGWTYEGHYGVATRGSFASDQAIHATALLSERNRCEIDLNASKNATMIWEIIYPLNRIVLQYGDRDELAVLGVVSNKSGIIEDRFVGQGIFRTSFAEAIALPIPDDEEGYVLDTIDAVTGNTTGHLKLKGDRYKELHGAIFGLSERKIWESIGRGEDMEEFVSALPDELQPWADGVINRLDWQYRSYRDDISDALVSLRLHFGVDDLQSVPRGDVARFIMSNFKNISGPMFSLLDSKEDAVAEWIHKQLRPAHKLFRVESEDTN